MGFWGIELKPGETYAHDAEELEGKLYITQATLGLGESKKRSIVECTILYERPVFLCSLLPNKKESCVLNLEFEPNDCLVTFSVIGKRSVHLSGYIVKEADYGSDSSVEVDYEIEAESSESDTDDDNDNDFVDDEYLDMYPASAVPNSGVVIEEIEDDEKPTNGNRQSKRLLRKKSSGSDEKANSQRQTVVKGRSGVPVLESEDEDGFPISTQQKSNSIIEKPEAATEQKDDKVIEKSKKTKKKKVKDSDDASGLKRKVEEVEEDAPPERQKKNKKKKLKDTEADEPKRQEEYEQQLSHKNDKSSVANTEEKTTKKCKEIALEDERKTDMDQSETVANMKDQNEPSLEQTNGKPSKARTYGNGMVIEDLVMGIPDGKKASPGKKVSIRYIGKLKNGPIFDSNEAGFRLGVGQVISGWDVGITGMRIGDKRRLTIPPQMCIPPEMRHKSMDKIPPNSWLVFYVELLAVQ